ncbi:phage tail protein [Chitinophaga japonensis]|uniref:Phage tail-like protein n=1 Tax=Chitinophaga japonensis TaxID=104662 RepID=A0A562T0G0_CHIJA|nr:phage tail protein [Chitinophaga japonensis]TWI87017.1 phage tail-like protein [Chitinophaga japonensis]
MSAFDTPQVGFHFAVLFEIFPQFPNDVCFQEVSGLSVDIEMETKAEGGEHRFVHNLPVRTKYGDVTLKQGKFLGSGILHWCRQATDEFRFKPSNVLISLMNADHVPLYNWYLVNAIPKRLDISGFNAQNNEIVVQTLVLSYQYFKYYDPVSVTMDLAAGLSASANINIGF